MDHPNRDRGAALKSVSITPLKIVFYEQLGLALFPNPDFVLVQAVFLTNQNGLLILIHQKQP